MVRGDTNHGRGKKSIFVFKMRKIEKWFVRTRTTAKVLNSNEGVADLVFTYDSRALADRIEDGTHYFKFKLKDNIPANLEFEYGEAIPWFNLPGNADQIKSSMKFQDLKPNIEILEVLKFDGKNKKWIKIK
jgi:hypothetical protein